MINNLVGPQDGSTSPIMQDHVINHAWDKQLELWVEFAQHNN